MSKSIFWKKERNIVSLLSSKLAQRVVQLKQTNSIALDKRGVQVNIFFFFVSRQGISDAYQAMYDLRETEIVCTLIEKKKTKVSRAKKKICIYTEYSDTIIQEHLRFL